MDEATARRLGARIVLVRQQRGMSLNDLADATKIAKSYLSKLEKGESLNVGLATLATVARALGLTVHDLLPRAGGPDESPPSLPPPGAGAGGGLVPPHTMGAVREPGVRFETIAEAVPAPLQELLDEEAAANRPVPEDARRSLAVLKLRGKRPETKDDYRLLYDLLRRLTS